jgi:hypothetical protein
MIGNESVSGLVGFGGGDLKLHSKEASTWQPRKIIKAC